MDFMGDRSFVGVHSEPGSARSHPVCLIGPDTRAAYSGAVQPSQPRLDIIARHQEVEFDLTRRGRYPA
jgi:hypothetical protein